mmetsp:Transcript_139610/g.348161  ORF Transcript_139610/g.348161 Transcript_139610/m.348161 type:complete len:177 (-) Transcript_139610:133-663(-)|eukprot:CAMPEP_0115257980 /NCGR_PEP_ID=MMETSP0270-20121206/47054_1 /TAXON_ID=71861 /ORGANISM="Scrippsiella trochoidea, Strain CCMP3099" /LENGTH=176 /DNA_ID=CAMNT_0002673707 /DNA_START=81 /DNA_END=611 /DNA_ORIENTATION=-
MVEEEACCREIEAALNPAATIWNDVGDPGSDSFHTPDANPDSFALEHSCRQRRRRGTGTTGISGASIRSNERDTFFSGGGDDPAWDQRSQLSETESSLYSSRRNTTFFSDSGRQPDLNLDVKSHCKPAQDQVAATKSSGDGLMFAEGRLPNSATPRCSEETNAFADATCGKRLLSL